MEIGLVIERSGSLDDTVLKIKVLTSAGSFSGIVYVSEGELRHQSQSLDEFASKLFSQADNRCMQLDFGPSLDRSPRCTIQSEVRASGKAVVTVKMWAIVLGANSSLFDSCTMHFATDLASIDAFACGLRALASAAADTAGLSGFDMPGL